MHFELPEKGMHYLLSIETARRMMVDGLLMKLMASSETQKRSEISEGADQLFN